MIQNKEKRFFGKKTVALALCLIMIMSVSSVFAQNIAITDDVEVVYINRGNFGELFEIIEEKATYLENNGSASINRGRHRGMYSPLVDIKSYYFSSMFYDLAIEDNAFCGKESPTGYIQLYSDLFSFFPYVTQALYDSQNKIFYYFPSYRIVDTIPADGVFILEALSTYEDGPGGHVYQVEKYRARLKRFPYVTVTYNDEMIVFDQKPVIENGRTLVPLRAIFEKIGADVQWNGDTQTVTATKGDTNISLTINNTTAVKNGQDITLDVPAKIVNGRTLVPVRFIADSFGVSVGWDGEMQRVILTK